MPRRCRPRTARSTACSSGGWRRCATARGACARPTCRLPRSPRASPSPNFLPTAARRTRTWRRSRRAGCTTRCSSSRRTCWGTCRARSRRGLRRLAGSSTRCTPTSSRPRPQRSRPPSSARRWRCCTASSSARAATFTQSTHTNRARALGTQRAGARRRTSRRSGSRATSRYPPPRPAASARRCEMVAGLKALSSRRASPTTRSRPRRAACSGSAQTTCCAYARTRACASISPTCAPRSYAALHATSKCSRSWPSPARRSVAPSTRSRSAPRSRASSARGCTWMRRGVAGSSLAQPCAPPSSAALSSRTRSPSTRTSSCSRPSASASCSTDRRPRRSQRRRARATSSGRTLTTLDVTRSKARAPPPPTSCT
mmetsp:Transcript_13025/g.40891  ORF Transcript_13025/g.40891 Transcript_13025/m.40891 type:complete len:371 (+) Transcript_13025:195-1307(+)